MKWNELSPTQKKVEGELATHRLELLDLEKSLGRNLFNPPLSDTQKDVMREQALSILRILHSEAKLSVLKAKEEIAVLQAKSINWTARRSDPALF